MKTIALLYERELDYGGVESHLLALIRRVDPEVFTFVIIAPVSGQFYKKVQLFGTKVIPFFHWSSFNPFSTLKLANTLKREDIDLVHIQSPMAAIPGRLAARALGLPAIVTVHLPVWLYHGSRQTARSQLGRWVYLNLDKFLNHMATDMSVYVSERIRKRSVDANLSPGKSSIVIPNGIDLERFKREVNRDEIRRLYHISPITKIVLFIGRLDEQKGLDLLLEAAARLQHLFDQFEVWLVGDGPIKTELESQSARLGLENRVKFWGFHDQIDPFLFASDILALPSRFEAMPIVLLEALAAGIPSVVTQVGDNDLVIEDGKQGLVVPPNDVNGLVQAFHLLVTSADMYQQMSEAAVLRSENFNELSMTQQYEGIYRKLLNKTG